MVLDEDERAVGVFDDLGEVALVGADASERFDARPQRLPRAGIAAR